VIYFAKDIIKGIKTDQDIISFTLKQTTTSFNLIERKILIINIIIM